MLQQETRCEVADNSGAKIAYVIRVYGGSTRSGKFTRRTAGVGDRVFASTIMVAGKIYISVEKAGRMIMAAPRATGTFMAAVMP